MKLSEYCDIRGHGAVKKLAKDIGDYASSVSAWRNGGRPVPIKTAVAIERATKGYVTRQDLCPDWAEIWPELQPPALPVARGVNATPTFDTIPAIETLDSLNTALVDAVKAVDVVTVVDVVDQAEQLGPVMHTNHNTTPAPQASPAA
jgi:DNA-binding transcriptional regulator YdaS (Cro superfamily)